MTNSMANPCDQLKWMMIWLVKYCYVFYFTPFGQRFSLYFLFDFQDLFAVEETCLPVDAVIAVEKVQHVTSAQTVKTITAAVFMNTVFPVV